MGEEFELRHLSYFENRNIFFGSAGSLRYRLAPVGKEKQIEVSAWKNDLCFECQESPASTVVPMTDEGLAQAVQWLQSQR